MALPEEYGITVRKVREDDSWVFEARVLELPDVITYGDTPAEAMDGALEVIQTTQQIFEEEGRPFPPVQVEEREYSGRVTFRMSKSLHRDVSLRAELDGVSLNQWIVEAVAAKLNPTQPKQTTDTTFVVTFPQKRFAAAEKIKEFSVITAWKDLFANAPTATTNSSEIRLHKILGTSPKQGQWKRFEVDSYG